MEAAAPPVTTGSKTMADLFGRAAEIHGDARLRAPQGRRGVARRQLRRGVGDRPRDRARPDRPRHPGRRPRLHPGQHAARVVVRRLRRRQRRRRRGADLPDQLAEGVRVGRRQLRGRRGHRRGRRRRWRRSSRSATTSPTLRHIIVMEPEGADPSAIALDDVRERGRGARRGRAAGAHGRGRQPDDPFTFIYTSGTTGPPKGCVLTHGNYRSMLDMCTSLSVLRGGAEADVTTCSCRWRTRSRCSSSC